MLENWVSLVVAAFIGAVLAWIMFPRTAVVVRKEGSVKHNQHGGRTVDDIAAKLESERVAVVRAPRVAATPYVRPVLPLADPSFFSIRWQ